MFSSLKSGAAFAVRAFQSRPTAFGQVLPKSSLSEMRQHQSFRRVLWSDFGPPPAAHKSWPKTCSSPLAKCGRCLMGRRLRADVDQRQLGLFGESLALGQKPTAVKALPVAAAQLLRSDVSSKHPPAPVKVEPPPRKSLSTLPSEVVRPAEAALVLSVSLSLLKKVASRRCWASLCSVRWTGYWLSPC
jgi:hypothetical protein